MCCRSPAKWRLSFMEGCQERAEPLDRPHDLSSLSGEVEAVARGDRSMQQCPDTLLKTHQQVASQLRHPVAHWMRRHSQHVNPAGGTSSTNRTYSRCSKTVSTVKKSTASTPLACARRNCRQESADRLGAGLTPARCRMAQTVLAPILYPSRHSSQWMRR